jgi:hypothetical protein
MEDTGLAPPWECVAHQSPDIPFVLEMWEAGVSVVYVFVSALRRKQMLWNPVLFFFRSLSIPYLP